MCLVKVCYIDLVKGKISDVMYGILLEGKDEMVVWNEVKIIKCKKIRFNKMDKFLFLKMVIF